MKTTLDVTGMTCKHCEKAVKDALESVDGVSSAVINLDSGQVEVTYQEKVTLDTIKQTIEDQGYQVA